MHAQLPAREDYGYFPEPMSMQLRKRQVAAAQALYRSLGVSRFLGGAQLREASKRGG